MGKTQSSLRKRDWKKYLPCIWGKTTSLSDFEDAFHETESSEERDVTLSENLISYQIFPSRPPLHPIGAQNVDARYFRRNNECVANVSHLRNRSSSKRSRSKSSKYSETNNVPVHTSVRLNPPESHLKKSKKHKKHASQIENQHPLPTTLNPPSIQTSRQTPDNRFKFEFRHPMPYYTPVNIKRRLFSKSKDKHSSRRTSKDLFTSEQSGHNRTVSEKRRLPSALPKTSAPISISEDSPHTDDIVETENPSLASLPVAFSHSMKEASPGSNMQKSEKEYDPYYLTPDRPLPVVISRNSCSSNLILVEKCDDDNSSGTLNPLILAPPNTPSPQSSPEERQGTENLTEIESQSLLLMLRYSPTDQSSKTPGGFCIPSSDESDYLTPCLSISVFVSSNSSSSSLSLVNNSDGNLVSPGPPPNTPSPQSSPEERHGTKDPIEIESQSLTSVSRSSQTEQISKIPVGVCRQNSEESNSPYPSMQYRHPTTEYSSNSDLSNITEENGCGDIMLDSNDSLAMFSPTYEVPHNSPASPPIAEK